MAQQEHAPFHAPGGLFTLRLLHPPPRALRAAADHAGLPPNCAERSSHGAPRAGTRPALWAGPSTGDVMTRPIDLYYWTTPNGHKITIFLEETGLPYRIVPINIGKG